jgi:hypothetical protein
LSRLQRALQVYAFAALGLFLIVAPWSPVWHSATAAYLPTAIGPWLRSGFAKGLVTGLGALDLIAALGEAQAFLRDLRPGEGDRSVRS